MKQTLPIILVVVLVTILSSCATTFTTHPGAAKTRDISESSITETNTIADLKVEEQKVTGASSGNNVSEETAKNLAVYDALKKVKADVLVEPSYDIDRTGNVINVTVAGFPGFYKNFRKPTENDSLILGWKVIAETPPVVPNTNPDNKTMIIVNPDSRSTTAPANNFFRPRGYSALATTPAPKANATAAYDDDAYKSEKRKGSNLLGWGISMFFAGVIIDACSPLGNDNSTDDPTGFFVMLGVGSAMMVTGAIMMPAGVVHLVKAKRIKNQSVAKNMDISFFPNLNIASSHYGGTAAFKF